MLLMLCRESQEFLEKYEGALGKGKGRKLYAYKVMMTKVKNLRLVWIIRLNIGCFLLRDISFLEMDEISTGH